MRESVEWIVEAGVHGWYGAVAPRSQIPAGAVDALATEITRAKKRLGLSADAPVTSCYEAGRDGFWLHRYLVAHGRHQ